MNIFKKIGIILSCSIIAFLGVFGVVVTNSNVNIQVKDLPVVERHNLLGSDVVLTEDNYMNYDLMLFNTYENTFTSNIEGNFIISGRFYNANTMEVVTLDNVNISSISLNDSVCDFIYDTNVYLFINYSGFELINAQDPLDIEYTQTFIRFNSFNTLFIGSSLISNFDFVTLLNSFFSLYVPSVDQFLPTITTIVGDCVSWFVSIFTGLSDTFVVTDSNGVITGLSAWGQVLFIGVAILLVSMALKWVISLVRGI